MKCPLIEISAYFLSRNNLYNPYWMLKTSFMIRHTSIFINDIPSARQKRCWHICSLNSSSVTHITYHITNAQLDNLLISKVLNKKNCHIIITNQKRGHIIMYAHKSKNPLTFTTILPRRYSSYLLSPSFVLTLAYPKIKRHIDF